MPSKKRKYNLNLVRRNYTYSVEEIAELLGLSDMTVFRWIADEGLKRLPDSKKYFVHGSQLIDFLGQKNGKNKKPCHEDEMYCCKCRKPQRPNLQTLKTKNIPNGTIRVLGKCGVCSTSINKVVSGKKWNGKHPLYPNINADQKQHEIDIKAVTTTPQKSDESTLFGDLSVPKIALVGTSNSKKEENDPNFEGALKETLSADVYNAAITGGGFDDSIISFLQSDFFSKSPPKILIWEFPAYYTLTSKIVEITLRQAIATTSGECQNPIVQKNNIKLTSKNNIIDVADMGSNFDWKNYYIHIGFTQPIRNSFSIILKDDSKHTDSFPFKAGRIAGNNYFYVPREMNKVESITMKVSSKLIDEVASLRICKIPSSPVK